MSAREDGCTETGQTCEVVPMEVKTNRSLISALYKIDGDARGGGAVGLNEDVTGVLVGTYIALIEILSLSQVPDCDLSILRSCR